MIQPDLEILDKILGLLKYGQSCALLNYADADSKNCRVEGSRRWTPLLLLLQLFLVVFEGCLKLRVGCLWEDIFTHTGYGQTDGNSPASSDGYIM